jgi:predicted RNase H-like HicB family nuclease
MTSRYAIIIYWSDEDGAYIAEAPELPGCMADGETYQKALAHIEFIMQEWIETANKLNRPIPEPGGRRMDA